MVSPIQQKLIDAQLSPAKVAQDVSAAVAAKALDATRQQGAAVLQLLEAAGKVQAGDPLVAKATGLGRILDVVA